MRYLKSKLKAISREYTRKDREAIIAAAGPKCPMCGRKNGDTFLFGPTNYLKQQIKFVVKMDIHVIEGGNIGQRLVVICNGCHLSYHLFNRLGEDASMGDKKLSDTLYQRCSKCKELNCMCCPKCGKLMKWCECKSIREKKDPKRDEKSKTKRMKLRSRKESK